jgi:NADP-dependent 3-hydroxy acid dehydrogenase YdfG
MALAVTDNGGQIIAAGRHADDLAESYRGMNIGIERVDVTDESSIAALAARIATQDQTIDTGAYDALGEEREAALFKARSRPIRPGVSVRPTTWRPRD